MGTKASACGPPLGASTLIQMSCPISPPLSSSETRRPVARLLSPKISISLPRVTTCWIGAFNCTFSTTFANQLTLPVASPTTDRRPKNSNQTLTCERPTGNLRRAPFQRMGRDSPFKQTSPLDNHPNAQLHNTQSCNHAALQSLPLYRWDNLRTPTFLKSSSRRRISTRASLRSYDSVLVLIIRDHVCEYQDGLNDHKFGA